VTNTTGRLRSDRPNNVSVPSDDDIDDKLHSFMERWDKRRDELADSLAGVGDALKAMHDAFDGTDNKLTGQLNCE
jgi:phage-related minor tail protein